MHLIISTAEGGTVRILRATQPEANRIISELSAAGERVRVGCYEDRAEEHARKAMQHVGRRG